MINRRELVRALCALLLSTLPACAQTEATLFLADGSEAGLAPARAALQAALGRVPSNAVLGLRVFNKGSSVIVVPQPASKPVILARLPGLAAASERDLAAGLRGAATDFGMYREKPTLVLILAGRGAAHDAEMDEARRLTERFPALKAHVIGVDLDDAGKRELGELAGVLRTSPTETAGGSLSSALEKLAPFGWSEPDPVAAVPTQRPPEPPATPPPAAQTPPPTPTVAVRIVPSPAQSPLPPVAPLPPPLPAPDGSLPAASISAVLGLLALFVLGCLQAPGERPRAIVYLTFAGILAGVIADPLRAPSEATPTAMRFREIAYFAMAGALLGFLNGTSRALGGGGLRKAWGAAWPSAFAGLFGAIGGALSLPGAAGACASWGFLGASAGAGPGIADRSFWSVLRGTLAGIAGGVLGGGAHWHLAALLGEGQARGAALALVGAGLGLIGWRAAAASPSAPAAAPAPPWQPGALARLVPLHAGAPIHLVSEEHMLGTSPECALIKRVKGEWFVFDKSASGTRVNGSRITARTPLGHGATVGVGAAELRFEQPQ